MDTTTLIQWIQDNWFIPRTSSDNEILPSSLLAGIPFSRLSPTLIAAIHSLSALTIGRRERAYSLLDTYRQARMREGKYGAKEKSVFAALEISDVDKACESAERMNRVMQLSGFVVDQRNYSNTQEISPPFNPRAIQEQDRTEWDTPSSASNSTNHTEPDAQPDQTLAMHDVDMLTPTATQPTPSQDTEQENHQGTPSRSIIAPPPTPHTQKRLKRLLPLQTLLPPSHSSSSSLPPVQSSFTPLFSHLREEVSHAEATVAYPDAGLEHQQQGRMHVNRNVKAAVEARVLAMQRATHEFNLKRIEFAEAGRKYEEARWRGEVARWNLERLKGSGPWRDREGEK